MFFFDNAAFIAKIAEELKNNNQLNAEQRQALSDLYYRPKKLTMFQIMQLLQIQEANTVFTQELIIYLWRENRNALFNIAKNNKYVLKLQEIIAISSSVNSNLVNSIKEITKELNFSDHDIKKAIARWKGEEFNEEFKLEKTTDTFSQKPFYKYFEDEVELPIPETPETERTISSTAYIANAKNRIIERQPPIKEQEKKRTVISSFRDLILTPVIKPAVSRFKQVATNIVNAFRFILSLKKHTSVETNNEAPNSYSSPIKDGASNNGYQSPTIDHTSTGYSSPSPYNQTSFAEYHSPSIDSQSPPYTSTSGFPSPSQDSSSAEKTIPITGKNTNFIYANIVNKKGDKQLHIVTTAQEARNIARKLFPDSSQYATEAPATTSPADLEKSRVEEIIEEEQSVEKTNCSNITEEQSALPACFASPTKSSPQPSPTKYSSKTGYTSPSHSPVKCSQEVASETNPHQSFIEPNTYVM